MNPGAPFTRSEAEIIRLITNLSVEDRPLVAIGSVLVDQWKDKLGRFAASYDLFDALVGKLGKRDSIRLFTLLALAAQSEKVGRGLSEGYLERAVMPDQRSSAVRSAPQFLWQLHLDLRVQRTVRNFVQHQEKIILPCLRRYSQTDF